MCEKELVRINGKTAKPAKCVEVNDVIEIDTIKGVLKYRVLDIPRRNVRKNDIQRYYEECR